MKNIFALAATSLAMIAPLNVMAQESRPTSYVYAGPAVGAALNQGSLDIGALTGYQYNRNGRLEASYDHVVRLMPYSSDTLMGNAIFQYPISSVKMTPYALAGLGYQWQNGVNQGVWAVGTGVRTEVTSRTDLDLRYRYVQGMYNQASENVVTVNTTFKF